MAGKSRNAPDCSFIYSTVSLKSVGKMLLVICITPFEAFIRQTHFLFKGGEGPNHVEASPLIWPANQWTGFHMIGTFHEKDNYWENKDLTS